MMAIALATSAHAAPISKCNAAKKKCLGTYVAAALQCHAKAEQKGVAVEAACLAKAAAKVTGGAKGCFEKLDAKSPNDCSAPGDASSQLLTADAAVLDVVSAVDPGYPSPTLTACGAARKKCAAKKAAGLMKCAAKANKTGADDLPCLTKVRAKFDGPSGCDVKALAKGPDCLGSTSTAALETIVDTWQLRAADDVDGSATHCGNGIVELGEDCDASAPPGPSQLCVGEFACNVNCTCSCPASVGLSVDEMSPETTLDEGWTGLGHRMPIASGVDLTLTVSDCAASRPCGTCALAGPIANTGATELRNQRCSNDTSIRCTDDAPCLGGGGTCEFYGGPPLAISIGGVGTCYVSRFYGAITGTVNVETGDIAYAAMMRSDVFKGFNGPAGIDAPCVVCTGDTVTNDDVQGGTCSGGPRNGFACDANGVVPGRPDFGATSLDCPPPPADLYKTITTDVGSASAAVTKTLTAESPTCRGASGRCLCETCNNPAAEPCENNADCPDSPGPLPGICGGRRCIGGSNGGVGCTSPTHCPGGFCGTDGEPTKPMSCLDDSSPVGFCVDTVPVDGEGECQLGPLTKRCSDASGHAQRNCNIDADCGGLPGSCEARNRMCFLTGIEGYGTGTLVANGAPSVPVANVASPTLGSVYCVPSSGAPVIDATRGFPGPARLTAKATMTFHP